MSRVAGFNHLANAVMTQAGVTIIPAAQVTAGITSLDFDPAHYPAPILRHSVVAALLAQLCPAEAATAALNPVFPKCDPTCELRTRAAAQG